MTMANPRAPGAPLVAVSPGFAELTGHAAAAARGRPCLFLEDAVPADKVRGRSAELGHRAPHALLLFVFGRANQAPRGSARMLLSA